MLQNIKQQVHLLGNILRQFLVIRNCLIFYFVISFLFPTFSLSTERELVVEKYNVEVSPALKDILKEDYYKFGSGLSFKKTGRKKLSFYIMGSNLFHTGKDKMQPLIGIVDIKKGKASLGKITPIELPDYYLKNSIKFDPEGVAPARQKHLWICDENGPGIIKVDSKTGKTVKALTPGTGLPEIIKHHQNGRGLEGITVNGSGKVYTILQAPLDLNQETKLLAKFIRLVEYDPRTKKTKMYAYLQEDFYLTNLDVKVGALQAIDNDRFILIEQGSIDKEKYSNKVFLINIKDATDISKVESHDRLEYLNKESLLKLVNPVKKELLIDLRELGWDYRKAEGISILNDGATIVVSNDPESELEGLNIWFIRLPYSLISWTWSEWALVIILPLIFVFFTMFFIIGMFNSKKTNE